MRFLKRLKNNKIRDAQGVLAAIPTDLFKVFYFILNELLFSNSMHVVLIRRQ